MGEKKMKLISCTSNQPLAEAISAYLGIPLTEANVRRFADQESFLEFFAFSVQIQPRSCQSLLISLLQEQDTVQFDELVRDECTRERIIVTFLALLELCRLKLIRIFQGDGHGSIWFVPAVAADPAVPYEVDLLER